jgi:tetratricopeptide (TPR) repeat protein
MSRLILSVTMAMAVSLVTGCGKCPEKSELAAVPEVSMLDRFYTEMQALEQSGGVEVAISRMMAMLNLSEYQEIRPVIFDYLLQVLIREGQLASVQDLYLEIGGGDAALADAGFRQIMIASLSGSAEDSVAWLEKIVSVSFPASLRTAAWQNRMELYAKSGSVAPAAARVREIMGGDLASSVHEIVSVAFSQGLQIPDFDGVDALLEAVRPFALDHAKLNELALRVTGELLTKRGLLDKAMDHYLEHAAVLGDAELSRGLRPLLASAREKGLGDLVQRGVDAAYSKGDVFPVTRDTVAAWTVSAAVDSGVARELLDATRTAFDRGASVSTFYPVFLNGFYRAIQGDSAEIRADIMALIARMRKSPGVSERLQGMMGTAWLDCAFFAQDFKGALAIIEEGIAGYDEKWHVELKDKIKAHIALQEERFEDAVALFQKHIERVNAWTEPLTNPEDGQPIIKQVVLGFNEKRIGDIWSRVKGREADSKAAYARARRHYQAALGILTADTPEYARAAAELAEVPAAE